MNEPTLAVGLVILPVSNELAAIAPDLGPATLAVPRLEVPLAVVHRAVVQLNGRLALYVIALVVSGGHGRILVKEEWT